VRRYARSATCSPCGCGTGREAEDNPFRLSGGQGRVAGMNEHIEVDSGDVLLAVGTIRTAQKWIKYPQPQKRRSTSPAGFGDH
jgi:hypothetical protein